MAETILTWLCRDDLAAWLIGLLADASRRKMIAFVLGDEQERARRQACIAALTPCTASKLIASCLDWVHEIS
jgi:hypothetical protein